MERRQKNPLVYLFPPATGAVAAAVVLIPAGTCDLPFVWAYAAVCGLLAFAGQRKIHPELIRRRFEDGLRRRSPLVIAGQLAMWTHLILAGLDIGRFHWSDSVPIPLRIVGLLGFAAGMGFTMWAMAVNQFFIPTVEVQSDSGHHVISTGPYGIVRHPGYTGMLLGVLSSGFALGSWIAFIPIAFITIGILIRVMLEDRFLRANLEGYETYSGRVRHRLVPWIW